MKRFILFLAIVGIIGVGIFVLTTQEETGPEQQVQQVQPQAVEPGDVILLGLSETMIRNIMKDALGPKFDAQTATHKEENLDHKDGPELIIGAAGGNTATIQVLTILNKEGEWERIGKVEYQELLRGAPEFMGLTDIDGDGQEEIIMSLMYGGASGITEGILDVDFAKKTMQWVHMRNENGEIQDAIFVLAASATHSNAFHIQDADTDGRKEVAEIFTQTILDEAECTVSVYEWNGALLAFDKTLSEQTLKDLGKDCAV